MKNQKNLIDILSSVTPGTLLREGLDNILDAGTGALLIIGIDENIEAMLDGGFFINCEYNSQRIYELAKMDGAIILDYTADRILYANVHMQPDKNYTTDESGTRHRTAQRIAKQCNKLVIAISEKRNRITLYKGELRYKLRDIGEIMTEATQAIKTFERYKTVLDKALANLTIMEFDDLATLYEVTTILQRFEMIFRIKQEVRNYVAELGVEGRLINLQLEELLQGLKDEKMNFIKDYYNSEKGEFDINHINLELDKLTDEELLEQGKLSFILGYGKNYSTLDNKVSPKGYRILGKITRLNKRDIEKIITEYDDLASIKDASVEDLYEIRGISKFKARSIKNGLKRLKFTLELER
ncbi:DNA integrity scanning diadenylate cyclase DisA [Ilyobacter polytropus]|uniref:DNA integrity scanning, DisA, linker region n=1 Tax=Ilyobacter polytropus (strain ATCC 51220 / DSM 2926 / LMG 16218 / CuHBu1) TaxID=572544 RepID=E3H850_ILYPC|nr:DNA integrity scanning diadenylate cyclase DisA [Ilyobacter polytropus]ADO83281.1 DNA integrity scanning, DisA, linker region [Ilyobacter polytropus DSM 2926]